MSDESLELFERRCYASPELVRALSIRSLEPAAELLKNASLVFCTGIGASEGPARLLASLLPSARFVPLSAFLLGDHRALLSSGAVLVLFSQKLSPNARMALDAATRFSRTVVVCGTDRSLEQRLETFPTTTSVVRHEPDDESGFLLRVTGPAVASAVAMSLAALVTGGQTRADIEERLRQCAETMQRRLRTPLGHIDLVQKPPAFLVSGMDGAERAHVLRWTLLECPDLADPLQWDLLSFAHGPYQNVYAKPHTLFIPYATSDMAVCSLLDRLLDMLKQTPHTFFELPSELHRPWSVLEHLACIHRLVLDHVTKNPRDLRTWPGQGLDGPIYDLERLGIES